MTMKAVIFFFLAGSAGWGTCGELEALRSIGLPDAVALPARIASMETPAPAERLQPPTEVCVLASMVWNECRFRCPSGATVTTPASRPDFSSGEPAGPCATYVLRPLSSGDAVKSLRLSADELRELLRDRDPEVRKAALVASRDHIRDDRLREAVTDLMSDGRQPVDIRVEAARALSHNSANSEVQEDLMGTIRSGTAPAELRTMAYKALWSAADSFSRVQDFLVDAVRYNERDRAVRLGAIWALFSSARDSRPKDALFDLARSGNEDEAARVEALKSLYYAMLDSRVMDMAVETARGGNERPAVRVAAVKLLFAARNDSRVRDLLAELARRESDADVRAAAIWASAPGQAAVREYFHLPYKLDNGVYVNPIDRE